MIYLGVNNKQMVDNLGYYRNNQRPGVVYNEIIYEAKLV